MLISWVLWSTETYLEASRTITMKRFFCENSERLKPLNTPLNYNCFVTCNTVLLRRIHQHYKYVSVTSLNINKSVNFPDFFGQRFLKKWNDFKNSLAIFYTSTTPYVFTTLVDGNFSQRNSVTFSVVFWSVIFPERNWFQRFAIYDEELNDYS